MPRTCGFCKERGHDKRTCQLRKDHLGQGHGKEIDLNSVQESEYTVLSGAEDGDADIVDIQQSAPFMEDVDESGPSLTCPFDMGSFTALLASCSPGFSLQA